MAPGPLGPPSRSAPWAGTRRVDMWVAPPDGHLIRREGEEAVGERTCRCGRRLASHEVRFEMGGTVGDLAWRFAGRSFCSPRCIREDFLEAFEGLEGLTVVRADAVVADIPSVYAQLADAFANVLRNSTDA